MALIPGRMTNRVGQQLQQASQLLTLLRDIKNEARRAIKCDGDCPILLGTILDSTGYPILSVPAAFYCEGSLRIVVNVDCNISRTEENLRIDVWHEVGHLAVYAKDPERYLRIHQARIPKSLDYTALNLFEFVPRYFSLVGEIPDRLFDLVLSDIFATAATEIAATPGIAGTVLSRHVELFLGASQRQIEADLKWDGIPVQGEATELLATQVVEELQKLRESPKAARVLSLLERQGARKGALGDLLT